MPSLEQQRKAKAKVRMRLLREQQAGQPDDQERERVEARDRMRAIREQQNTEHGGVSGSSRQSIGARPGTSGIVRPLINRIPDNSDEDDEDIIFWDPRTLGNEPQPNRPNDDLDYDDNDAYEDGDDPNPLAGGGFELGNDVEDYGVPGLADIVDPEEPVLSMAEMTFDEQQMLGMDNDEYEAHLLRQHMAEAGIEMPEEGEEIDDDVFPLRRASSTESVAQQVTSLQVTIPPSLPVSPIDVVAIGPQTLGSTPQASFVGSISGRLLEAAARTLDFQRAVDDTSSVPSSVATDASAMGPPSVPPAGEPRRSTRRSIAVLPAPITTPSRKTPRRRPDQQPQLRGPTPPPSPPSHRNVGGVQMFADWPYVDVEDVARVNKQFQEYYVPELRIPDTHCQVCFEKVPGIKKRGEDDDLCRRCKDEANDMRNGRAWAPSVARFGAQNRMLPRKDIPAPLQGLTQIEESLIAMASPLLSCYTIGKGDGQTGYKGNIVTFHQDVGPIATTLPKPGPVIAHISKDSHLPDRLPKVFTVRRLKVAEALVWLKFNNRFYKDLNIDQGALNRLPLDGIYRDGILHIPAAQSVTALTANVDPNDDPLVTGIMAVPNNDVNNREAARQQALRITSDPGQAAPLKWPSLNTAQGGINEFRAKGLWSMAFPCLYPDGEGDYQEERMESLTLQAYVNHLMRFYDGRFARHKIWIYFAVNMILRWRALGNAKVFIKNNPNEVALNRDELRRQLAAGNTVTCNRIIYYASTIAGTPSYWLQQRRQLLTMVSKLGLPTFFFTFSSADTLWPEFRETIVKMFPEDANLSNNQLIAKNPYLADLLFQKRYAAIKEEMFKLFGVEDHWDRSEYQHRGSPHTHGLCWLKYDVKSGDALWDDPQFQQAVCDFVDKYCCELKFAPLNQPARGYKPTQAKFEDVVRDDMTAQERVQAHKEDLANILEFCQQHTNCHRNYCLRAKDPNRPDYLTCRYGFPKEFRDKTDVKFYPDSGKVKIRLKRNHGRVNCYNPFFISIWRANMDIQPCLDMWSVIIYLTKYISKEEPKSEQLHELIEHAFKGPNDDQLGELSVVRKILCTCVGDRDYSAQEVCRIATSGKMTTSSRAHLVLNTDSSREIRNNNRRQNLPNARHDEPEPACENQTDRYMKRKDIYEGLSMFNYYKTIDQGRTKRKKEAMINIVPRYEDSPDNEEQYELWCRQQLLCRVPFRNVERDLQLQFHKWADAYEDWLRNREDQMQPVRWKISPGMIAGLDAFNSRGELIQHERFHEESFRPPNDPVLNPIPDLLGAPSLPNFSWDASGQNYDLDLAKDFIAKEKSKWEKEQRRNAATGGTAAAAGGQQPIPQAVLNAATGPALAAATFQPNAEQQMVLDIVAHHIVCQHPDKKALRIFVHGTAGVGKSFLIEKFKLMLPADSWLVMAPTGSAAFNVGGATLHSTCALSCNSGLSTLTGAGEIGLQKTFEGKKILIIDEMSMVGKNMFGRTARRLQQARPADRMEILANFDIIALGDLCQLPPVVDKALYDRKALRTDAHLDTVGDLAFQTFRTCINLHQKMRQQGDPRFGDVLDNIRWGIALLTDWQYLTTRVLTPAESDNEGFGDAVRLFINRNSVNEYNSQRTIALSHKFNCPIANIKAEHVGKGAESIKAENCCGLEPWLGLVIGSKVMLTQNLWTEKGLVNGARGSVREILYRPGVKPPELPVAIMLKMLNYDGPYFPNTDMVPINPVKQSIKQVGRTNKQASRRMFPLMMAEAVTVHKCQGMTLNKAVLDLGEREMTGATFVGTSRVKNLTDLELAPLNFDRYKKIEEGKESSRFKNIEQFINSRKDYECACGYKIAGQPMVRPQPPVVQQPSATRGRAPRRNAAQMAQGAPPAPPPMGPPPARRGRGRPPARGRP